MSPLPMVPPEVLKYVRSGLEWIGYARIASFAQALGKRAHRASKTTRVRDSHEFLSRFLSGDLKSGDLVASRNPFLLSAFIDSRPHRSPPSERMSEAGLVDPVSHYLSFTVGPAYSDIARLANESSATFPVRRHLMSRDSSKWEHQVTGDGRPSLLIPSEEVVQHEFALSRSVEVLPHLRDGLRLAMLQDGNIPTVGPFVTSSSRPTHLLCIVPPGSVPPRPRLVDFVAEVIEIPYVPILRDAGLSEAQYERLRRSGATVALSIIADHTHVDPLPRAKQVSSLPGVLVWDVEFPKVVGIKGDSRTEALGHWEVRDEYYRQLGDSIRWIGTGQAESKVNPVVAQPPDALREELRLPSVCAVEWRLLRVEVYGDLVENYAVAFDLIRLLQEGVVASNSSACRSEGVPALGLNVNFTADYNTYGFPTKALLGTVGHQQIRASWLKGVQNWLKQPADSE